MNIYDKAYELARAIQEGEEAQSFNQVLSEAAADPAAKRLLDRFRERQTALQQQIMAGEEPEEAELASMNRLYEELDAHPLIHRVFEAERRLAVIYDDVNRILANTLRAITGSV
ncbi:cell fate (sporulation/competence/biofilm development) regulator YlbF (YheA/YmcA/DUF963 family) [Paenibacillus phyllosphaerae]|uniref:Cell fate (Sporulation/competence/biofilm development) regulator YlbF (YheA/YmcA/DUF963 family) n=1 Tax=Paenibacillus phyllosphaerae TaxID=274593 RepID=A0A7W5AUA7_9BACL|nr:YlbF family regulator [Paenibacillus phyllosphaerae]MBB3108276.1 cell fate (sporulation/competence/biofilm development) regulator YlbF (YheA/YmcA/DUF963 family) [Paenibacillus phyllosphaerae]